MKAWHIIVVLALCLLCFLAGRHTNRAGGVLVGKNDTLILYDTIRDSIPYPVYETVIQTVPEMFPIYITLDGDSERADRCTCPNQPEGILDGELSCLDKWI